MRYFKVPFPIQLVDPMLRRPLPDDQQVTFRRYAYLAWLNSPSIVGAAEIRRWGDKVVPVFENTPGNLVSMEDQDWEKLRKVIEEGSTSPFSALIEYQLLLYRDVVLNAMTELPVDHDGPELTPAP